MIIIMMMIQRGKEKIDNLNHHLKTIIEIMMICVGGGKKRQRIFRTNKRAREGKNHKKTRRKKN